MQAHPSSAPLPVISPRTRNVARRSVLVVTARRGTHQSLAFTPRDFVLFGLPYKQPFRRVPPPAGDCCPEQPCAHTRQLLTEYRRQNGHLIFELQGRSELGLPTGKDRLLAIWLATAFKTAGQPEDNCIRFRAASDILRAFDHSELGGAQFQSLRGSLARWHGATYFVQDRSQPKSRLELAAYRLGGSDHEEARRSDRA